MNIKNLKPVNAQVDSAPAMVEITKSVNGDMFATHYSFSDGNKIFNCLCGEDLSEFDVELLMSTTFKNIADSIKTLRFLIRENQPDVLVCDKCLQKMEEMLPKNFVPSENTTMKFEFKKIKYDKIEAN